MIPVVFGLCLYLGSTYAGYASVPYVTTSQFHSQDEFGQYSYGYTGDSSSKQETKTVDGVTRGSYSYVDANGVLQSTYYVSDPIHGFRVAATNLPKEPSAVISGPSSIISTSSAAHRPVAPAVVHSVAPAATFVRSSPAPIVHSLSSLAYPSVVSTLVRPVSSAHVQPAPGFDYANGVPLDTPEVAAAKAAHYAAHGEALARIGKRWKRSLSSTVPQSTTVVSGPGGSSFSYSTVSHAPVAVAAPTFSYSPAVIAKSYHPSAVARPVSHLTVSSAPVLAARKSFAYSPAPAVSTVVHHASPVSYTVSGPIAAAAAAAVHHPAQVGTQDNHGQYSYGYSDGFSSKMESRTADGVTHGGYSYVDSNGVLQTVKYVADAAGFRVHATNLPVA